MATPKNLGSVDHTTGMNAGGPWSPPCVAIRKRTSPQTPWCVKVSAHGDQCNEGQKEAEVGGVVVAGSTPFICGIEMF